MGTRTLKPGDKDAEPFERLRLANAGELSETKPASKRGGKGKSAETDEITEGPENVDQR